MKSCLSVECYNSGSLKLIGQFYCDVIGCKSLVANNITENKHSRNISVDHVFLSLTVIY